jgi:hypothetical protein
MGKHQAKIATTKNGVPNVSKAAERPTIRKALKPGPFAKFMEIIDSLERASIHYRVDKHRDDGISIEVAVPGERWEVDVLEDGEVDFERFVSNGHVGGEDEMNQAIAKWAEPAETTE